MPTVLAREAARKQNYPPLTSDMIDAEQTVIERAKEILAIARQNLVEFGSLLPTAVLHTIDGMFPIVLPFKDARQKKALVAFVKKQALEMQAYAITTVTCARVVDSRTGIEEESIVLATAIQGGRPHSMMQTYLRGPDRRVAAFGEPIEGDEAAMPGQMMIIPDWEKELIQ